MTEPSPERKELEDLLRAHQEVVIQDESDVRLLQKLINPDYDVTAAQVRWAHSLFVKQKGLSFREYAAAT